MYLLPAIDLLDGRAVRLAKGDYHAVTVYNDDPAYQAQLFEEAGATWLHVVDLDGAKSGNPDNLEVVRAILARTSLKVEVGGGVRSLEAADRLLDAGATRVILGTALVRDPDFAQAAMEKFGPDALVAGIDAKAGEAAVAGWTEGSGVAAADLARRMAALGYEHLVYTDIAATACRPAWRTRPTRRWPPPLAIRSSFPAASPPQLTSGRWPHRRRRGRRHYRSGHLRGHSYRGRRRCGVRRHLPAVRPAGRGGASPDHRRAGKLANKEESPGARRVP